MRKNASGKVCLAHTPQAALEKATKGCILVVRQLEEAYRPIMDKVGAVLVEGGALIAQPTSSFIISFPIILIGIRINFPTI